MRSSGDKNLPLAQVAARSQADGDKNLPLPVGFYALPPPSLPKSMATRPTYRGPHRKLVLTFDVGTTFSGISYCILDPGEVPEIRGVTRFPGQGLASGDSKIPTIIYYDQDGNVCAAGAEAVREGIEDEAEDRQWTKAEWFKLHLRPKTEISAHVSHQITPLPRGKSAIDVYADFLRYLHSCARSYIEDTHASGVELWGSLTYRTEFVLSHPNGWEGAQQSMMRTAAVKAGLIPDNDHGHSHLSFVTEGEASLHYCIGSGLTGDAIKNGKGILIVDAGGGTIDVSAYRQQPQNSESYEEISAPQCHFHGSIFVTAQAKKFLEGLLGESQFASDIPRIVKSFDKTTKLGFRNENDPQHIRFGGVRDTDLALNIRAGKLTLLGSDVASFFQPSLQSIVNSIEEQCKNSVTEITSVFLVGGFASNDWLYQKLKDTFTPRGLDVSRPHTNVNKTVPDGAVSFFVDHFVSARVSKFAYGIEISRNYNPSKAAHKSRENNMFMGADGQLQLAGIFDVILPKNKIVSETQDFKESYRRKAPDRALLEAVAITMKCYRGDSTDSEKWMDEEPSMYSTLCDIKADTTELCKTLPLQIGAGGELFYEIQLEVVLALGLTELKAHIRWEGGTGPAEVVYDYRDEQ